MKVTPEVRHDVSFDKFNEYSYECKKKKCCKKYKKAGVNCKKCPKI